MGRVSNRFSHDLQTVDKEVMAGVIRFGDMLLALVGVLVVTVYAVPPLLLAMVRCLRSLPPSLPPSLLLFKRPDLSSFLPPDRLLLPLPLSAPEASRGLSPLSRLQPLC